MIDNGYDISDYQAIHPQFGTLADMDRLISEAKTENRDRDGSGGQSHSDQHPWFKAARSVLIRLSRLLSLARGPSGKGDPADMQASFGGSAWTKDASGDFYFHLFAPQHLTSTGLIQRCARTSTG
jgi:glycosidase